MLNKGIKFIFDQIDYHLAKQVPSMLGYGHQIDARKRKDANTIFIHSFIENLTGPLNILELAAGRGVLARELIEFSNVKSYLACDIDPSGLEVLDKRAQTDKNYDKLQIKILNVLDFKPAKTNVYDVVIADKLLHLLSPNQLETLFKTVYEILKPGGYFVINSASIHNFVYDRTYAENEDDLYRKLRNDRISRLWYNISNPYVFFITEKYIRDLSTYTGFELSEKNICLNQCDYLTLAISKTA